MKSLICADTEQSIHLIHRISVSGEGEVWETDDPTQLAKIYASPGSDRIRKLQVMVECPPRDPNVALNHVSFAWPTTLLQERNGTTVGFLMPNISNGIEIINVYNPRRRKGILPGFNWMYLHTTAMNVASLIWRLHETGLVLGDIKPQNILVNSEALPSIIDTDSFQIRHPQTGEVFPCPVGSEGFTPRELLGKDLATVHQSEIHDRFRLGIVIYLLLFGEHPFKGQWIGAGDSPEPNELIEKGFWPFAEQSLIEPSPLTIPLTVVHPQIRENFIRCFNQGHNYPHLRPSAQEWVTVLSTAIDDLKGCWSDRRHYYSSNYGRCIWCERRRNLGIDVFNVKDGVVSTYRTSPIAPKKQSYTQQANLRLTPQPTQQQSGQRRLTQRISLPPSILPTGPNSFQTRSANQSGQTSNVFQHHEPSLGRMPNSSAGAMGDIVHWLRSPSLRETPAWLKVFGGIGVLLSLFMLLIRSSSFEMTSDEIGLSFAGATACLILVLVGVFWIKLLRRVDGHH